METASNLSSRHRKDHDRPYQCSLCERSFGRKADRERHKMMHARLELSFECSFPGCPFKGTNRKDYLWKHMSKHHTQSQSEKGLRERYENVIRGAIPPSAENQRDFDLIEASRARDERKIRELAAQLPETSNSETHSQRRTILHLAAHEGHETVTRVLLESGADINERSVSGETAFFMAIKAGHTAIVRLFLDKGSSVHEMSMGDYGPTPLAMAAEKGHVDVVKVLIENGSIPERWPAPGFSLWPALERAVAHNQEEIVALLIESGINVNQKSDYQAHSALHQAVIGFQPNIVKILLEAQADLESRNRKEWTPLYTSLMQEDRIDGEVVSLLVDAGAHVSPECWERFTPELRERHADRCPTQ